MVIHNKTFIHVYVLKNEGKEDENDKKDGGKVPVKIVFQSILV